MRCHRKANKEYRQFSLNQNRLKVNGTWFYLLVISNGIALTKSKHTFHEQKVLFFLKENSYPEKYTQKTSLTVFCLSEVNVYHSLK